MRNDIRKWMRLVEIMTESGGLMKTEILAGVRSGGTFAELRKGTVPTKPFDVQVNPTPGMLHVMIKQSDKHSVRILASGKNIATTDAWKANHADIWQTLCDAGHPMATQEAKRIAWGESGSTGWRIELDGSGRPVVMNNTGFRLIPEADWPLGLKRAMGARLDETEDTEKYRAEN